jgi:tetratricopeptide (TPR) repeat protein
VLDKLVSGQRRTWPAVVAAAVVSLAAGSALSLEKQDVLDCEDISDVNRMIKGCTNVIEEPQVPAQLRSMILVRRGFGYLTLHKIDAAISDFSEAVKLDPKNNGAYNELGLALQEKGDTDGAIAAMTEAVNLASDSAASRFNRGNMFLRAGKLDDAIRDYGDAIKLGADPNTVFAGDGQTERPVADRVLAG